MSDVVSMIHVKCEWLENGKQKMAKSAGDWCVFAIVPLVTSGFCFAVYLTWHIFIAPGEQGHGCAHNTNICTWMYVDSHTLNHPPTSLRILLLIFETCVAFWKNATSFLNPEGQHVFNYWHSGEDQHLMLSDLADMSGSGLGREENKTLGAGDFQGQRVH